MTLNQLKMLNFTHHRRNAHFHCTEVLFAPSDWLLVNGAVRAGPLVQGVCEVIDPTGGKLFCTCETVCLWPTNCRLVGSSQVMGTT